MLETLADTLQTPEYHRSLDEQHRVHQCFKYTSPNHPLSCQALAGCRDAPHSQPEGVLVIFIKTLISSLLSSSYEMGKNQAPRMMTGSGRTVRGIFPSTGTVGAHPHHGRARSSFRSSSLRPTWELTYLVSRMWLAFSSPSPPPEKQATDA